jgi:aspartyl-tRNA(Asn)/glutamyl-tRNA(Gln) amidotransferase subunit A
MSEEICYADAATLARRIRDRELSPVEVVQAHLDRIEAVNPKLNALIAFPEGVMERAREAESEAMRGEFRGPLHGVPFTVKDCVDTAGVVTTRGSRLFENHVPEADATVVARLKHAGGIFIAKSNMPEFALWWETDNLVYGRTENPWMIGRTPGGSSGGEAAAIASGMSPLGIGSDVGGSIREPANYCGIVGLKATHGRIPLTGHWPETLLRFMHVGPIARSVGDAALALSVMAGPDGADHYALPVPLPELDAILNEAQNPAPPAGLRVAWCPEGPFAPVEQEVQDTVASAAAALGELGCSVEPVSLDGWESWPGQQISARIFAAEGNVYLDPIIEGRQDMLALSMQRRLNIPGPTYEEYLEAMEQVEQLRAAAIKLFNDYDVLLLPTGPMVAHPHDTRRHEIARAPDVVETAPARHALTCTVPFDLTGSPALSVPFGMSDGGLPIGVQIVGRHFEETTILRAGAVLEELHRSRRGRPSL